MRLNSFSHHHRRRHARGGTFLGLIVGVVVGLAAALAVAIYVAKVPIPFVNKAPVHNSDQDAAEDQKNRNWNPNTPLQTRGPTVPASSANGADSNAAGATAQPPTPTQQTPVAVPPPVEVTPSTAPTPTQQPTQPQAHATPRPATTPPPATAITPLGGNRPRPTSGDVLGDFATARAHAAGNVNTSAATAEPFIYYVQTGAFSTPRDADAERARLSLLGMEAAVSQRDQAGRLVYRVRVGPFQNKVAADQIRERLAGNGFDAALVRTQR